MRLNGGWSALKILKLLRHLHVNFLTCLSISTIVCYRYWIDEASAGAVDQRVQKGLFLFACTNSCMNPIVYGYFNFRSGRGSGYRVGRRRADQQVRCCGVRGLRQQEMPTPSEPDLSERTTSEPCGTALVLNSGGSQFDSWLETDHHMDFLDFRPALQSNTYRAGP